MKNNKQNKRVVSHNAKEEKRRSLLNKKHEKKERNQARYGVGSGAALVVAKASDMNRRLVAAFLALVFVLTSIVVGYNFMVKAVTGDEVAADGTYTGESTGYQSRTLRAVVTISDGKITAITATYPNNTDDNKYAQAAAKDFLSDFGSATAATCNNVNAVTTHEYTSSSEQQYGLSEFTGVKNAVLAALGTASAASAGSSSGTTGGMVLSKELTAANDGTGTYDLTLEAYATGSTTTSTTTENVPLDIALVIDQSGSMATQDMNPTYTAATTPSGGWTVSAATSGTTYYYKVGDKYYPVQAQEGTVYEKVSSNPQIYDMIGSGHDGISVAVNGAPTHFNVPTNYYCLDSSGNIHRVWIITAGMFLEYYAYPYYYVDENDAYASYSEWKTNIYWAAVISPWDGHDYDKLRKDDTWKTLTNQSRVRFLGYDTLNQAAAKGCRKSYSWISDGNTVSGLYLPKDGTSYNGLYYVDDSGNKVQIGSTVATTTQAAYTGTLYTVTGQTRVSALQSAVTQFVDAVAQNAQENNVDHKIAIIGFAGNKFPANSSGQTAYNTTIYDYTDSGVFLNNSFKNYQTITGYQTTSDRYINLHYYIKSGSSYIPVYYSGGYWYRLDTGASVSSSTTFYEPVYADLTASDYQAALVEASQKTGSDYNGTVNANLTDAIANFGYYGGTYTSYGMHMANELFANNDQTFTASDGTQQQRKRVIIVFTDGEPGPNGYSSSIAGEALVDGNEAKYALDDGGLNASVYTIGLFPGNASTEVTTFMKQLSSEYTVPVSNVYGGTSYGASNNYALGDLDASQTYYYTDSDGKTYAVTAQKDGLSTLGWWAVTSTSSGNVYTRYYPKTASDDNRTGTSTFYDSRGRAVYEGNLYADTTYYTYYGDELHYEYLWYNSNNKVREPKTSASDNATNHWQFFQLGTAVANTDGYQYYYKVSDQSSLEAAFTSAFDVIKTTRQNTGAAVTIDATNSALKDIISDSFDVAIPDGSSAPVITVQTAKGTQNSADADVTWSAPESSALTASYNSGTITVTGFDYAANYIAYGKAADSANGTGLNQGRKLIVTIKGLTPKPKDDGNTGTLYSNTAESGVYNTDDNTLISAFPRPSITRHSYTVKADSESTASATFTIVDENGQQIAASDLTGVVIQKGNSRVPYSENALQNIEGTSEGYTVYIENLPAGAKVQSVVTYSADAGYDATLSVKQDGTDVSATTGTTYITPYADGDVLIEVTSEPNFRTVTLAETVSGDYAIEGDTFDVTLTLTPPTGTDLSEGSDTLDLGGDVTLTKNSAGTAYVGTVSGLLGDGTATTLNQVPYGWTLVVTPVPHDRYDVAEGYPKYTTTEPAAAEAAYPAAGLAITSGTTDIVIHNIAKNIPVTGISDDSNHNWIIYILAGIAILSAGAGAAYVYRRKRLTTER